MSDILIQMCLYAYFCTIEAILREICCWIRNTCTHSHIVECVCVCANEHKVASTTTRHTIGGAWFSATLPPPKPKVKVLINRPWSHQTALSIREAVSKRRPRLSWRVDYSSNPSVLYQKRARRSVAHPTGSLHQPVQHFQVISYEPSHNACFPYCGSDRSLRGTW